MSIQGHNDCTNKANSVLKLTTVYLVLNQAAYAIVAFPIGIILSIGPILLKEQKKIPLERVGLFMAGGEALGIVAMKMAEMSTDGFIVSRPHDLHLIIALTAVSLILMPIWSSDLWYLTGITMMIVQAFNSASKPVIGESLHRLAILTEKDPCRVFAQANMFRRIGNACVGPLTILIYVFLSPSISFYAVGVLILLYLAVLSYYSCKINGVFVVKDPAVKTSEDTSSIDNRSIRSTINSLKTLMGESKIFHYYSVDSDDETSSNTASGNEANGVNNGYPGKNTVVATSTLNRPMKKEDGSSVIMTKVELEEDEDPEMPQVEDYVLKKEDGSSFITTKVELKEKENPVIFALPKETPQVQDDVFIDDRLMKKEDGSSVTKAPDLDGAILASTGTSSVIQSGKEKYTPTRKIAYALIVHAYPFWDAAISRLPFAFLTVAIVKDFSMSLAAGILFAYQSGRALSQVIQVSYCTPPVGYILNSLALITYTVLVIYIEIYPGGRYWFVPFAFLGLSETLAIQQFYLLKLFDVRDENGDNLELRHAVKASHTGTGVGSMVAFIVSSRIYTAYLIRGVSYLGLSIQLTKIFTNLLIDWTLCRLNL